MMTRTMTANVALKLRQKFNDQIMHRACAFHNDSRYNYGLYWLIGLELRMMNKEANREALK